MFRLEGCLLFLELFCGCRVFLLFLCFIVVWFCNSRSLSLGLFFMLLLRV